MEMNTRLQVEHPVTEMITGQDLVAWQLQVAQGEVLPLQQADLRIHGHSMEVRIYAEDPDNEFLPTTGTLHAIRAPSLEDGKVRLDTGVQAGDEISPFYDPMIAKLIVWGEDRQQAVSRLQQALHQYQIAGVTTNLSFLRRVVAVDAFAKGQVSTQFIDEFASELSTSDDVKQHHFLAAVAFHLLQRHTQANNKHANKQAPTKQDQNSPWQHATAFRLNQAREETLYFMQGDERLAVTVITADLKGQNQAHQWQVKLNDQIFSLQARLTPNDESEIQYCVDHQWLKARVLRHGDDLWVYDKAGESHLRHYRFKANQQDEAGGNLKAPMNGTIIQIDVSEGQAVKAGDALLIMEAMKMEHSIKAPHDGIVKALSFNVGDLVNEGTVLAEIETLETEAEHDAAQ